MTCASDLVVDALIANRKVPVIPYKLIKSMLQTARKQTTIIRPSNSAEYTANFRVVAGTDIP